MTRTPSRLLIDIIDWGYPAERVSFRPTIWDLADESDLMKLVLSFGNGTINELRAEGEAQDALDALRGLAASTGGFEAIDLAREELSQIWFYAKGDVVLRQGAPPRAAYVLLDPIPRPDRFPAR